MSFSLIVGPKCMLAVTRAAPPPFPVSHDDYADGTDRQMDRQTDGWMPDAASVIREDQYTVIRLMLVIMSDCSVSPMNMAPSHC